MEVIVVDETLLSKRLDIALSAHPRIASRSEAKKMIQNGLVRIDGSLQGIKPNRILKTGDTIAFSVAPVTATGLVAVPFNLQILYEDNWLLVVHKPQGMVVHPGAGHQSDTLVNYLLCHSQLSNLDATRPGIVHRIDKDTSGLLVVAKDNRAHEYLAQQFAAHSVVRIYQSLVWGVPNACKGTIDKPLGRHPVHRKKFSVREKGKSAVTHWRVLEKYRHTSLLECRPRTGRTHQIRVHLDSIGHPALGDQVYGRFRRYARDHPKSLQEMLRGFQGQALHAKTLGFIHPNTRKNIQFDSQLPQYMQKVMSALRADCKPNGGSGN